MSRLKLEQILFSLFIGLIFLSALILSQQFPDTARRFPRAITLISLIFLLIQLIKVWLNKKDYAATVTDKGIVAQFRKIAPYILWIIGFYGLIALIGLVFASAIFIVVFLLRYADMKWYFALLSAVVVVALMLLIGDLLSLRWPFGLLGEPFDFRLFGTKIL